MNRTKLILITFMLGTVVAHGKPLYEPQASMLTLSRNLVRPDLTTASFFVRSGDAFPAPVFGHELNVDQSGFATTDQNLASTSGTSDAMNGAAPHSGSNGNTQTWLIALASMAMVTWQLWRKQKSLRFGQSCLAKEADYAVH